MFPRPATRDWRKHSIHFNFHQGPENVVQNPSPVGSSENGHGGANGESKANIAAKKLECLDEEINRPRGTGPVTDDLGGRVVSLGFAKTDCRRRWSRFRAVELSESGEGIGDKPYGARPAAR
jgi:hypothetical protein